MAVRSAFRQPLRSSAFSDPSQNSLRDAWRTRRPERSLPGVDDLRTRVACARANSVEHQKIFNSWGSGAIFENFRAAPLHEKS